MPNHICRYFYSGVQSAHISLHLFLIPNFQYIFSNYFDCVKIEISMNFFKSLQQHHLKSLVVGFPGPALKSGPRTCSLAQMSQAAGRAQLQRSSETLWLHPWQRSEESEWCSQFVDEAPLALRSLDDLDVIWLMIMNGEYFRHVDAIVFARFRRVVASPRHSSWHSSGGRSAGWRRRAWRAWQHQQASERRRWSPLRSSASRGNPS